VAELGRDVAKRAPDVGKRVAKVSREGAARLAKRGGGTKTGTKVKTAAKSTAKKAATRPKKSAARAKK